jgi:hypothetical protein
MHNYIESLKTDLKKEAETKDNDGKFELSLDNKEAVYNIFEVNKNGENLFKKLETCRNSLLNVDSSIKAEFEKTTILSEKIKGSEYLTAKNFKEISTIEALALLSNLQNKIKITENDLVTFCFNKSAPYIGCGFGRRPRLLVSQSSSYVKAGEKIEIIVGVGTYSSETDPLITVNNKVAAIGIDGSTTTKIKASDKPGKHFIPVKVTYTQGDGTQLTQETEVEYEVAKSIE